MHNKVRVQSGNVLINIEYRRKNRIKKLMREDFRLFDEWRKSLPAYELVPPGMVPKFIHIRDIYHEQTGKLSPFDKWTEEDRKLIGR